MNMKKLGTAIAAAVVTLASPAALAAWTLDMTPGITDISQRIFGLHRLMYWWCVALGFFVFGWMIYSLVAFRKSRGAQADAKLTHNTKAEIPGRVSRHGNHRNMGLRPMLVCNDAKHHSLRAADEALSARFLAL